MSSFSSTGGAGRMNSAGSMSGAGRMNSAGSMSGAGRMNSAPAGASAVEIRTHRVGSITAGLSLIVFGALFAIHLFTDIISIGLIFKFSPIIVIGLGVEMLLGNIFYKKLVYDKGAVAIMVIMAILASCMAGAELMLAHVNTLF